MTQNKKHIDKYSELDKNSSEFFSRMKVPYSKTKEEVWNDLFENLEEEPEVKVVNFKSKRIIYSIAAVLILFIGISAFIRFYSKSEFCPAGEHLSLVLPDGSTIKLNAYSEIKYKPYWWRFERKVKFNGEGFFEITKGKNFEIESDKGTTVVLGTSFNIYARSNDYVVTCVSGKVKVLATVSKKEVILNPNQKASISKNGELLVNDNVFVQEFTAWMDNVFIFTSTPLYKVFEEIGRQYDKNISLPEDLFESYSGNFEKEDSIDQVLEYVCAPFGLSFKQKSDNEYIIVQN